LLLMVLAKVAKHVFVLLVEFIELARMGLVHVPQETVPLITLCGQVILILFVLFNGHLSSLLQVPLVAGVYRLLLSDELRVSVRVLLVQPRNVLGVGVQLVRVVCV